MSLPENCVAKLPGAQDLAAMQARADLMNDLYKRANRDSAEPGLRGTYTGLIETLAAGDGTPCSEEPGGTA